MVSLSQKSPKKECTECGNTDIIQDPESGEVVCTNCLGDTPWYDAIKAEDDVITQDALEGKDEIIFCDKCKKKL